MNQIYGSAARVIVWLGKATPELVAGVKAAERIGTESTQHTVRMLTTQTWDFGSTISNMQEKYGIDPIAEEDAIGLAALFACNYFVRIWIVQEVSLTDNVVILCNGNFTPFDCVCYTAGFLHYSGLYQQVYALVPPPKRGAHVRGDTYMFAAERIALIRDWCKREKSEWAEGIKTLDLELGLGDTQPKSSEMLLLRFLVTAIAFKSTDPRDIIYGLVGLMKQTAARDGLTFSSDFEPDYSIDVNDLLTAVAKRIIETTDSLAYLGLVKDPNVQAAPGLPSWVPNFPPVQINSLSGANFRSMGILNASKHVPHSSPQQVFSVDGTTLNVSALCLGKVDKLGEIFMDLLRGQQMMNADILLSMEKLYPYTGQSADEVFWPTLLWDTDLSYRPAKQIRLDAFQKAMMQVWIRPLSLIFQDASSPEEGQSLVLETINMSYLDQVSAKFPSSILPSTNLLKSMLMNLDLIPKGEVQLSEEEQQMLVAPTSVHSMPPGNVLYASHVGHRLFLTDSGYLGMGYESVEVGDEVWIIRGCPTPLVLRREGEKFSLIGESYVHGVMTGEAVGDDTKWEKIQVV